MKTEVSPSRETVRIQMPSYRIATTEETCNAINALHISTRRGDLPNVTKKEMAELTLAQMPYALTLDHGQHLLVEYEDGRLLCIEHHVFPATETLPELREWSAELFTLQQRTPRCLRKWKTRKMWVYRAPYNEVGYTTDPLGLWSYKVWA